MSVMPIIGLDPNVTPEALGLLPFFIDGDDPRPAKEQFDEHYQSGWSPQPGFKMSRQAELLYPGDPPLRPIAVMFLRKERIFFYPFAYVAIVQPDGSFEAARMD